MLNSSSAAPDSVDAVRAFTRFYTGRLGVLQEGLLESTFSLTEARVLFELATRNAPTAAELGRELGLDAGYLSRILRRFEEQGLIMRARSKTDGRQTLLILTEAGHAAFAPLDQRSRGQVSEMLSPLSLADQRRLVQAMETVRTLLGPPSPAAAPYILRPHRPGDMGWIVHRHGALYAQEYGWDETFEALVAEIAATFIKDFDPKRERCWIAEKDGEIVGSVLLVAQSNETAKLRLLYVEPKARGLGIGRRFVDESIRFARAAGYSRIVLWTNDVLHAARNIYAAAGFELVKAEPHRSFGQDLVGEEWELAL
jgi:DNA-binding MarR family transcriptional regulator/GNAT superfamily N-acetyltransferase